MPKEVNVRTAERQILKCCGRGQVMLSIDGTELVTIEALVVDRQLLGFDHIFGIDAIRTALPLRQLE